MPPSARVAHVIACCGRGRTRVEERVLDAPREGELILRLRVAGLCGTDIFKLDTDGVPEGTVLGHEIVGEVVEKGAGVDLALGDRVVVPHHVPCGECALCRKGSETMCSEFRVNLLEPGGFASALLVRRAAALQAARRVPDDVSDEAAVFMEPAACVLRGVRRAGLDGAGLAVVVGAGSMGLLHLLVLRATRAATRVVVVDLVSRRRELALGLGADAATAPGDEARAAVRSLSDGLGADAVFDTVGGARTLNDALGLCREGGSVVLFAHAPDGEAAAFDLNDLFKHEKRVVGTYSGTLREQREVFELIAGGALDPRRLVTHRLPLAELEHGVDLVKRRQALKVLLVPTPGSDSHDRHEAT